MNRLIENFSCSRSQNKPICCEMMYLWQSAVSAKYSVNTGTVGTGTASAKLEVPLNTKNTTKQVELDTL